ncbi:ATP-dependent DNA helicase RecG [Brevibacterium litoralis]|uniref:ATP-dependent DNA helicase RecG n=1 Tax=Brevibacterium litoralis TaxID=3138935 RepID=UPI0032EF40C8
MGDRQEDSVPDDHTAPVDTPAEEIARRRALAQSAEKAEKKSTGKAGRKPVQKPTGRMLGTPVKKFITRKRDVDDLAKLGIETVDDAFRYFPRTYIHPGRLTPLDDLEPGTNAVVQANVVSVTTRPMRQRRGFITSVLLTDGSGQISATFFNQPWLEQKLIPGDPVVLTGQITEFNGRPQVSSPKWLNGDQKDAFVSAEVERPIPVYKASKRINSFRIWRLITTLLDTATEDAAYDPLPPEILRRLEIPDYRTALDMVHRPARTGEEELPAERWKYEEAFALQAELMSRKARSKDRRAHELRLYHGGLRDTFDAALPFSLTDSQRRVGDEIAAELATAAPMNRLLQGDVGSGKTLVALRAVLQAADSDVQSAFLAPTEVLAVQHYRSLRATLGDMAVGAADERDAGELRIGLLTGTQSAKERKKTLLDVQAGRLDLVVGTHALVAERTGFWKLGLVVVDEQHRFGVRQREALREKGTDLVPHTLVMTATPIPRTVAMTVFGDLDVSSLTDLPGGPKRITSHAFSLQRHPSWMQRVLGVVAESVARGEQAYFVASRIETQAYEPATEETPAVPELLGVEDLLVRLRATEQLQDVRIGLLHGRMKPEEKETVMTAFAAGQIDVLVATTVIEVGIDVPNARTIVVYDADRFGVAQLHQLRGRVGRDGSQATCFFVTNMPDPSPSFERLQVVAGTLDGFRLAEYDTTTRREGDVLGRHQAGGRSTLRYLSVLEDEGLIGTARDLATEWVDHDPDLTTHPALRDYVQTLIVDESEDWIEAS